MTEEIYCMINTNVMKMVFISLVKDDPVALNNIELDGDFYKLDPINRNSTNGCDLDPG